MFFIFGYYGKEEPLYEHSRYCTSCEREQPFQALRKKHYLSIFFIPVPLGRGRDRDVCAVCGTSYSDLPYGDHIPPGIG